MSKNANIWRSQASVSDVSADDGGATTRYRVTPEYISSSALLCLVVYDTALAVSDTFCSSPLMRPGPAGRALDG